MLENGSYSAKKDTTVIGRFSMVDVYERQIVTVVDGDSKDTAFVECGPACTIEVSRKDGLQMFELLD